MRYDNNTINKMNFCNNRTFIENFNQNQNYGMNPKSIEEIELIRTTQTE
jgi:hypothetical protein